MHLTRRIPNILLAAVTAAAYIWACFAANFAEQFVCLNSAAAVLGSAARWIASAGFIALPAALLYGEQRCRAAAIFAVLPATLFGLAFSGPYFAVCPAETHEIAAYAAVNLSVLASCTYLAFGGLPAKKEAAGAAKLLPLLLLGVFPLNIFMQVRPLMTAKFLLFRNFGPWHIFFILLLVAATVAVYFLLRKKSGEERFVALFLLSLALFFQLAARFSFVRLNDYQTAKGIVGALPLYVCSFGIMLLPFAIISGSSFFRGALFMINCPGAIIAFVWPDTGPVTVLHYNVTYFVFSHILLFVVTAHLAISLGGAPRRAHLGHLAYAIAAYYLLMVILNAVAVRFGGGYDPNFSFVAKCPLPLPLHELLPVHLGILCFSPPYIAILCAVQFALCLVTYFLYRLIARLAGGAKGGKGGTSGEIQKISRSTGV